MERIILNHLKEHGNITSWEAIQNYNCTRLSHYIWVLRREGYIISGTRIPFVHKITGKKSTYMRYELKDGEVI